MAGVVVGAERVAFARERGNVGQQRSANRIAVPVKDLEDFREDRAINEREPDAGTDCGRDIVREYLFRIQHVSPLQTSRIVIP